MKALSILFFLIGQFLNSLNLPTQFFDDSDIFQKAHGTVIEQTYEGYAAEDDVYIIDVNGQRFHILGDDLQEGDEITTWLIFGQPSRTVYGHE